MKIVASSSLNSSANTIKKNLESINSSIKSIETDINNMKNIWLGKDADSFVKKYKDILQELKRYEASFEKYQDYLSKVYDIYKTLDDAYNKQIDTN